VFSANAPTKKQYSDFGLPSLKQIRCIACDKKITTIFCTPCVIYTNNPSAPDPAAAKL